MRKLRLWSQLFISFLWIPLVAALFVGVYGSRLVEQLYQDHLEADLEARARLCSHPIGELLNQGRTDAIDALSKELGQATGTRITVVLPSGQVVADSEESPADMDPHAGRPEIRTALAGATGRKTRFSATEQEERIYVAVPLRHEGVIVAAVRTSVPLTALTHTLTIFRNRIIAVGLIGIAIHALVSLLVARRISRPLEDIREGAQRFAAGDLAYRLRTGGSVEIDTVARAVNRMAEQLDERIRTILSQQHEQEAMLSSMEEGVLAIDRGGTILSLNETCAALLDGDVDRLRGRTVYEVIRKPDLLRFVESTLASGAPVDAELRIRGPQDRWLIAHGTALHDAPRGRIGVLIVLHDVTRLRHLETVRRDFVANVSHELRTPVTSLKGFVETLLDGALEDQENAARFLGIMLRQVNRLDAIIGDLLSLSRIERGAEQQTIELAQEPIRPVLQAAVELCAAQAADKGIRIDVDCAEDLAAEANAALLEQAAVNLLDNAIKYSGPGTTIRISAGRDEGHAFMQVGDEGCGIEAKHLPRLFERFYRVETSRSRELGGTGLGLAIVKHIALAHGGTVSVQSTVGSGSTFAIRWPIARAGPAS
jgi:two-component system phosphate regulon sensor histidine kinase PhoR